jgi:uncharacterized membrane protein (DUF485 family)
MASKAAQGSPESIAAKPEFRRLLKAKARFIIPACAFFVVYYFALPVTVGYFPDFMSKKVLGPVNLAYLFALSQFFMAWTIAALYVRAASKFDAAAHALVGHLQSKPQKGSRGKTAHRKGGRS